MRTNYQAALTLVASLFTAGGLASSDGKCYALAFSAADESAGYQAGVLKGLIETNGSEQHDYDAISGVDGGAVNAAIFSSFKSG